MPRIRAVGIVIHEQKLLLMSRRKKGKSYFVFPGGGVEEGESLGQAVMRELKEETSVDVAVGQLAYRHLYDTGDERDYFLCRYLSGTPKLAENSEEAQENSEENYFEPRWVDLKDLPYLLIYPLEIRDWLIQDLQTGFPEMTRTAEVKEAEMRQE